MAAERGRSGFLYIQQWINTKEKKARIQIKAMLAHEQIQINCGYIEACRVSGRCWAGGMAERHLLVLWEGLYNVATAAAGA